MFSENLIKYKTIIFFQVIFGMKLSKILFKWTFNGNHYEIAEKGCNISWKLNECFVQAHLNSCHCVCMKQGVGFLSWWVRRLILTWYFWTDLHTCHSSRCWKFVNHKYFSYLKEFCLRFKTKQLASFMQIRLSVRMVVCVQLNNRARVSPDEPQ